MGDDQGAHDAIRDLKAGHDLDAVLDEVLHRSLRTRRRNPRLMTALHEQLAGLAVTPPSAKESRAAAEPAGWERVADVLATRPDTTRDNLREKTWLVTTMMETVGRRLVHEDMPDLEQETILALTREACVRLLAAGT